MTTILHSLEEWRRRFIAGETHEAIRGTQDLLQNARSVGERSAVLAARSEWLVETDSRGEALAAIRELAALDEWLANIEQTFLDYRGGSRHAQERLCELWMQGAGREERSRARMALAAGKICSDAGHLEQARSWMLASMAAARLGAASDVLAAAVGALGEVLYLGGKPLLALDAFQLDEALLPHGSRHTARLAVYRAHCLRELGQLEAAEGLYQAAAWREELAGHEPHWARRGLRWVQLLAGHKTTTPAAPGAEAHSRSHCAALEAIALRVRAPSEAEELRKRAEEGFLEGRFHQEARAIAGKSPESSAEPALPDNLPQAECDGWYASAQLTPRRETLEKAASAFRDGLMESWTRAFF